MKYLIALILLIPGFASAELSFDKDIKPIVKNRCAQCHNSNTPLPDLAKYEVAYAYRFEIKKRIQERSMPHYGFMKESERDLLVDWVNQGGKK